MTNRRREYSLTVRALGLLSFVLVGALGFELACQVYARAVVFPDFDDNMGNPRHYYQHSARPILSYELRPDTEVDLGDRRLHINVHGIREETDDLAPDLRHAAVLGDSVVFGVNHDQDRTLSLRVQEGLDPAGRWLRVHNFGVGGFNLREVTEQLRIKGAIYGIRNVVYLLNPNDFAPRDTRYEGADNGLYRMYERPTLMSLWFARKAVYRLMKGDPVSVRWYQWMFDGNEDWGYEQIASMKSYADANDIALSVVLLPSAQAYDDDGSYQLGEMYDRIGRFLEDAGIPHIDASASFADEPSKYLDPTDHFHEEGIRAMASILVESLQEADPGLTPPDSES